MNKKIIYIVLCFCVLCTSACKKKKNIGASKEDKDLVAVNAKVAELNSVLDDQRHQHQCINAKFNIQVSIDGKSYGGTGELRQAQDEMTFLVVKKFGIEIGRAWISTDSLLFINRWQREYIYQPLQFFEDYYGAPAKLALLQELFTNVPAVRQDNQRKVFTDGQQNLVLSGQSAYDQLQVDCVFRPTDRSMMEADYVRSSNEYVRLFLGEEREQDIYTKRAIDIKQGDEEVGLELSFKSIETGNCKVPPLEIPSGYERVDKL